MFYIPKGSIRDLLEKQMVVRHFRINKTYNMLHKHFLGPKMKHDVHKCCSQCFKYIEAKSKLQL